MAGKTDYLTALRASAVLKRQVGAINQTQLKGIKMEAKQGMIIADSTVSNTEKGADGKGKRVAIGTVKMAFATAEAIAAAFAKIAVREVGEDGLPIYESDVQNVIVDAVNARIDQRNKSVLVPGTIQLMAGKSFVTCLEDLVSDGSGKGEWAKRRHECIAALCAYVKDQGRSDEIVQRVWLPIFSHPQSLLNARQKVKDAALAYVGGFADTLSDEQTVRYSSVMSSIIEHASAEVKEDDDI